ncbi:hypothetical protein JZ751_002861 [Albula glossodonta]|uniref:Endoplasmic reticulum membrane protein complex subunit 7 n=1 Tax=Albula glossodonta TaxID=121402 RepID=A0A8T2N989_9TELE|nr:hypothetical protein JZ751_002861 [Albula glossodonta]
MLSEWSITRTWLILSGLFAMSCAYSDMEAGPGSAAANGDKFRIEGRAVVPGIKTQDWISTARVLVEGEEHVGFLKTDGSFAVNDVPSGSYIVEIISPSYRFEPVRVDITSKGKMRARIVNNIKTSEVVRQPYPLQMRSTGPHSYFIKRDSWGWSDFLMNPMVMMMVLPLLIIVLLPKVVNTNDPEMRREMEQSMNMLNPNHELPDVSEFMTKLFSSKSSGKAGSGNKGCKSGTLKRRAPTWTTVFAVYLKLQSKYSTMFPGDCYEIWQSSGGHARDGVYLIQPAGSVIMAYCSMQEGGWTVVQHITVNSSVDFDRSWTEYKLGFGTLTGDHWLGNEYLHQLTSRPGHYKLGVKLVDKDAITKFGEYDPVLVENEEAQYRLRLGLFQGTAVDALSLDTENYLHDNQKFTTKDRDNDNYFQNCAKLEFQGVPGGGWWYDACAGANLNRRNVIYWQKDCNKEHLCKYAWMMVKPSDLERVIYTGGCQKDEL